MKRQLLALPIAMLAACVTLSAHASITTTKHNLAVSSPGTMKATSEKRVCIFCHTPHTASLTGALWNRSRPGATYTPYTSSTARGGMGQPTGSSLLCLSCHDGTIALGSVLSSKTPIGMSTSTIPTTSASYLGTNLSDDHPVSFAYSSSLASTRGELAQPSTLTGKVRLDKSGQMQCTSCHDPHDNSNGNFLVMSNSQGALCNTCHQKNYWAQSDHNLSAKTWNGSGTNPWPHAVGTTVASNACGGCHNQHSAPFAKWLQNAATEEANCYPCHNGNVAAKNIQTEFNKVSIHNVALTTGVHDAGESALVSTQHVECQDCHNPHASNTTPSGSLSGSLIGVKGVNISGAAVNPATAEHQICFRCHGDSPNQSAPKTARVTGVNNTRLDFVTTNKSCHPVAGACPKVSPASNLVSPWTSASTLKCGDCHNNNAGPGNGGTGPAGPHGSTNPSLLERSYTGTRPAMCAKCHTTTYVKFNGGSSHSKHTGDIAATCNTCHDPHGSLNYPSLINFDTSQVTFRSFTPSTAGQANNGSCNLTCHGKNHTNCSYTNC